MAARAAADFHHWTCARNKGCSASSSETAPAQKQRPGDSRHRANFPMPNLNQFSRSVAQPERVQGAALWNRGEIGRLGHGGSANGTKFIVEIQTCRNGQADPTADA